MRCIRRRVQQELAGRGGLRRRGSPRDSVARSTRSSLVDGASEGLCQQLGRYGARKVYRVPGPEGLAQPVVDAMASVIGDAGYGYALFGGGLLGFEIGAGLAARLGGGVAMEVTGIRVDGGKLIAQRRSSVDSQISEISFRSDVGIIIGRLNAFEIAETAAADAQVQETVVEFSAFSTRARMISRGEQRGEDIDIEGADILVAGGRGLGNAEGFALCEELAKGVRRAQRGRGNQGGRRCRLVPLRGADRADRQDRLTEALPGRGDLRGDPAQGRDAGLRRTSCINKDRNAPIFEFSDLGIVGDLNKILPKLSAAVRSKKAQ